jgi:hypothetical protein
MDLMKPLVSKGDIPMNKICALICCAIISAAAFAQEDAASAGAVEAHTDLSLTISSLPEAQVAVSQRFVFPVLQGQGPLTSGNNLTLKLGANVSPISFNLLADTVWTPIAFFNLSMGAKAGSGWNYPLFGSLMKGIGLHTAGKDEGVDGSGLDGVVWNAHTGATLQFDLAAIFPGDWHHVVAQVYNEITYLHYTNAQDGEPWYYENDDGINQNSFYYYFSALLGYQMPFFIDLAGVMFEVKEPLLNPATGENLSRQGPSMTLSLAAEFKPHERFSVMALGQLTNKLFHPVTDAYQREWDFFRVALIATYHLK